MATRSIYQSNGKPLSQQALYQQKLKQGVYNSPGTPSVGVSSNASDTAALLAASSDLTVKPSYERVVAVEAHNAAQAARNGRTSTFSSTNSSVNAAAAVALGKQGSTGVPNYKASAVYAQASSNSTKSLTTRTDPERDYRSGLLTLSSMSSSGAAAALNIGKISSVANANSSKSLNSRFNPDLDFRSGLQSGDADSKAAKSFTAADVVNQKLLNAANDAAQKRLAVLNSLETVDFKQQAQLYAKALALAQQRSNERIAANKAGVIDLGGGLTIELLELDRMAQLIVQPILQDMKSKADIQREIDEVEAGKRKDLADEHEKYKVEQFNLKIQEKMDLDQAKKERFDLNEEKKQVEVDNYGEHQELRNTEVETKAQELVDLNATHAESKAKLLERKEQELSAIETEENELISGRKDELKTMQDEKDEIIKPTLDELAVETDKLKETTDARDSLKNEVSVSQTTNDDYKKQIEELEAKLKQADEEFEEYTTKLSEASQKHEETSKDVDELHVKSAKELEEAERAETELDGQISELETSKATHLETKENHKKDILVHIDDKVKAEHKINEELPEHLRKDVDEKKLRDTLSIFSKEAVVEPVKPAESKVPVASTVVPSVAASVPKEKKKSSFREKTKKFFTAKPDIPSTSSITKAFNKDSTKKPTVVSKSATVTSDSKDEVETIGDLSVKKAPAGGLFKEEI